MQHHIVTVAGEELYGLDGVYARFEARLVAREGLATEPLAPREKRNILIGEIGELAVKKMLEEEGYSVDVIAWQEFTSGEGESAVDLIGRKGQENLRVQVKASEVGNRCIEHWRLLQYERQDIDKIYFVAVRLVPDFHDVAEHFIVQLMSAEPPKRIRMAPNWVLEHGRWIHIHNDKFMRRWEERARQNLIYASRHV